MGDSCFISNAELEKLLVLHLTHSVNASSEELNQPEIYPGENIFNILLGQPMARDFHKAMAGEFPSQISSECRPLLMLAVRES